MRNKWKLSKCTEASQINTNINSTYILKIILKHDTLERGAENQIMLVSLGQSDKGGGEIVIQTDTKRN